MPVMSLRPGEVFAGYTVERELGAGGMGSVYLARHPRLPRFDALKLLRPELCSDPAFVGRFEREADTVAQLDHPNIVAVHDRGSADGQLWISMRFIDGTNAEKALAGLDEGMPPERVVRIISKVASALDYAHKRQLLHRDVKPANILLTSGPDDDADNHDEESERVFLSDFGVAKAIGEAAERISSLTSTGSVVATLDYASPEQIKGQVLDHRSDIYALGCVLYKLLTGTVPFPGDSVAARVYGHLNNVAPPPSSLVPSLPSGFDEVARRATAKDAEDRYPTCRALAVAARAALTSPVRTPPAPAPDPDEGLPTTMTSAAGTGEYPRPPGQSLPPWLGSTPGAQPEQSFPPEQSHSPGQAYAPPRGAHTAREESDPDRNSGPPPEHSSPDSGPGHGRPDDDPADQQAPGRPQPEQRPAALVAAPPPPPNNGKSRRRATVIGASVASVVVIAAVAAALILRGNVGGTATLGAGTASAATTATAPASSDSPASSSSSAAASSPATSSSPPGPVPGLPHSEPLTEQILLGSRTIDGSTNMYQFDATTGALGTALTAGAGGPQYPILSPDRGSVIYVQSSSAGSELRTAAVDGTDDRTLFATWPEGCTNIYRPAWNTADPTMLALSCTTAEGNTQVHSVAIDGTDLGIIDIGFPVVDDLTYSPDGTTIAFWGSEAQGVEGTIFTRPADGSGPAIQLVDRVDGTSDADPSFSPDGSRIAFRRVVEGGGAGGNAAHLYVVNTDGTDLQQLTDGPIIDQDPIWSPDGSQIAFKSNRPNSQGTTDNQIWVMNADGTDVRELGIGSPGTGDGAPAWGHR